MLCRQLSCLGSQIVWCAYIARQIAQLSGRVDANTDGFTLIYGFRGGFGSKAGTNIDRYFFSADFLDFDLVCVYW